MPQLKVEQGIQAARTIFGKCFLRFREVFRWRPGLRYYRYEFDQELKGLRKEPVHDQYSHAADPFRTAAVIREPERKKSRRTQAGIEVVPVVLRCKDD